MADGTAVTKVQEAQAPAVIESESSALISMIERAARDPNVDIDKMERLFGMHERMMARSAKAAYLAALSAMQPHLPVIEKKGKIERGKHKATGEAQKASPYAKYEDVIDAIKPHLDAHGFSLSFRISQPDPARILVTGVLGHKAGHSEETSMSLPLDDSGGKNNVQGWGSSVSYGKRYTAFALLNIAARGEDDDGKAAGAEPTITEEQAMTIRENIEASGSDLKRFLQYFKIANIADMRATDFDRAMKALAGKQSK